MSLSPFLRTSICFLPKNQDHVKIIKTHRHMKTGDSFMVKETSENLGNRSTVWLSVRTNWTLSAFEPAAPTVTEVPCLVKIGNKCAVRYVVQELHGTNYQLCNGIRQLVSVRMQDRSIGDILGICRPLLFSSVLTFYSSWPRDQLGWRRKRFCEVPHNAIISTYIYTYKRVMSVGGRRLCQWRRRMRGSQHWMGVR